MPNDPEIIPEERSATIELAVAGRKLQLTISASTGPSRPVELLPLIHSLSNAFAAITVETVEEMGRKISCKAHCGACCRQLVPISEIEARGIAAVVEAMPEPRRSEIRERFAAARQQLEKAGLLDRLLTLQVMPSQQEFLPLAREYFSQQIACPFLEDESCSIYPDRPAECRAYLVVSPAENCREINPKTVQGVAIKAEVHSAMSKLMAGDASAPRKYIPLIMAPEWAATNPDTFPARSGVELLQEFFGYLSKQDLSGSETAQQGN